MKNGTLFANFVKEKNLFNFLIIFIIIILNII